MTLIEMFLKKLNLLAFDKKLRGRKRHLIAGLVTGIGL